MIPWLHSFFPRSSKNFLNPRDKFIVFFLQTTQNHKKNTAIKKNLLAKSFFEVL
jgi:hypothetical protein